MTDEFDQVPSETEHDAPHIIMTYTALLSLAILRDDFSRLDRPGLIRFLRSCQKPNGRSVSRLVEEGLIGLTYVAQLLNGPWRLGIRFEDIVLCFCH